MNIQIHPLTLCLWWLVTCLVVATPMNPPPQGNNWAPDPSSRSTLPNSHLESTRASSSGEQASSPWPQQPFSHDPATSHPSLDHDHYLSDERPLDQEDQRILDSLLDDLMQNQKSNPGVVPDDDHERFLESLIVDPLQSQPKSPGAAASSSRPASSLLQASARDPPIDHANDGRVGEHRPEVVHIHWEPKSMSRFLSVKPFGDLGRKNHLFYDHDEVLRHQINHVVFAGKLRWALPQELAGLYGHHYRNRWPVKQTSRQLPFVYAFAQDNSPIPIYMTNHYPSRYTRNLLDKGIADNVLEGRPHYFFWGVRDTGTTMTVTSYGAGRIEPADFKAVDNHLTPLLDYAQRAALPHV